MVRKTHLPWSAKSYMAAVVVAAMVSLAWLVQRPLTLAPMAVFLLLAALAVVLEARTLTFAHKGAPVDFSLGTPFVLATMAVFGVLPAVLVQLVAAVVADLHSRKPAIKLVLNASLSVVAVTAAGAVLEFLLSQRLAYPGMGPGIGDLAAVLSAAAVFLGLNNLMTGVMVALVTRTPLRHVPRRIFSQEALIEASSLLLVPPVVVTAQRHPLAICFLLVPLAALYRALRIAMDNVTLANERTRALEDRQATERRFRSMVQHSSDLMCLVDRDGHVLYTSASIERIAGYSADGATWHLLDRIHPDDRTVLCETLGQAATTAPLILPELRLLHADGHPRWIEVVVSSMPAQEPVGGMVLNIRDVTDRHRLETQLRQSQKFDALGRLAGGIAHDFNNLLSAVRGFTEFAREAGPADEHYRGDLDEVLKAADRGAGLVDKLLTFSRDDVMAPVLIDVNDAIADMSTLLQVSLSSNVDFRYRPARSLPLVRIDRSSFEQVLVNLAVNARDAMDGAGAFEVVTAAVDDDAPPGSAGWVRLHVRDTGSGMDHDTLEQIFEPFFTTKDAEGGTGLGLATIYAIVKDAGGRIEVDSSPGAGTTFTIDLPAVSHARDAASVPVG